MTDKAIEKTDNWKNKTLLIGTVLGALTGLGTAYMLVQRADDHSGPPTFTPGEGLKLSLLLLGLIRQVIGLFE